MCPCVSPSPKYELESGGFDKDQCQPHRDGEAGGGGVRVTRAWVGRGWSPNRRLSGRLLPHRDVQGAGGGSPSYNNL